MLQFYLELIIAVIVVIALTYLIGFDILKIFIVIIAIMALVYLIASIYAYFRIKKEVKCAKKKNQVFVTYIDIMHLFGIPWLQCQKSVTLRLFQKKISIGESRELLLKNLTNIYIKKETELLNETTQKHKSVLLRAGVGGILFGPVGSIVGGMSGIPSKTETKNITYEKYYLIIEYISKQNEECMAIFGQNNGFPLRFDMENFVALTIDAVKKIKPYEFEPEL